MRPLGKHMVAKPLPDGWSVTTKRGAPLGHIAWHDRWRTFEFVPLFGSAFTHDCLQALAVFLVELNAQAKGAGAPS